jgi:multidrug efflux pump subunit AcrA (membrane-fusion protein)
MANKKQVPPPEQFFNSNQISWAAIEAASEGPSIISQVGVFFLFSFFLAVTIYAFKTEIPVIVEGVGKITSSAPPVPIRSSATFTVNQLPVKDNQKVQKGQVLANSAENLRPEELAKVRALLASVERINALPDNNLCLDCTPLLNSILQQYLAIRAQGEMLNLLSPMNDQVRQLAQVVEQYNEIESGLVATRLQIKNAERKLQEIRRRNAEKVLAKEVEELETTIINAKTQISEKFRGGGAQVRDLRRTLKARTKELQERMEQFGRSYAIYAPNAGKVINLKLKGEGELVSSGQVLMEIIPEGSPLIASVDIQNKDVSNVKVGDEVIVSVDSLPEMDYGTMTGTVKEIVQVDPEAQKQGAAAANSFRINVTLPAEEMAKGNLKQPLILGMTLRGRVVTRYESLAKAAYRVLFKVKDEIQVSK